MTNEGAKPVVGALTRKRINAAEFKVSEVHSRLESAFLWFKSVSSPSDVILCRPGLCPGNRIWIQSVLVKEQQRVETRRNIRSIQPQRTEKIQASRNTCQG